MATPLTLLDGDRAQATVYPELGGWLVRYAKHLPRHGWVEALNPPAEVIARYPDRMWAGNPVLFPHVSYNVAQGKEGQYELNGRLYQSPQHGFARRVPWTVTAQSPDRVTLELTDSERTRPSYPFAFRHTLTYRLANGRLELDQTIENRDPAPLPFSAGFHPYFNVPLTPGGERNRCHIRIPRATRYNPIGQAESFFAEPFPAQNLGAGVDVSGTVFLGEFAEKELALVDPAAGLESVINFAAAPAYRFAALWSHGPGENFYCLEPWTALPNSFGRPDGEITVLPPGETFHAHLWIDVRAL
jgi:galactose mutarotase-like enzyme